LILAGGLICVWFAFRYHIKEALIMLYILFSDAILLLALLALTRLPFNVNLLALFTVMTVQSVFALVFLFDKIKTSRVLPGYTNLDEAGMAQAGFNESFKKNLIVFGVSCIAAIALLIGTTDAMLFAVAAFVSILTGALNAVFVAPALYAAFDESKKQKPVKRQVKGSAPKAPVSKPKAQPAKPVQTAKPAEPAEVPVETDESKEIIGADEPEEAVEITEAAELPPENTEE